MFFILLLFYAVPLLIVLSALIDVLRNEFDPHHNKIIWVLVIIFIPVIGSILYWIIGRNQRLNRY